MSRCASFARAALLGGLVLLGGCSPVPPTQSRSPAAVSPPADPSATPSPPGFLLPGEAATLPALPAGVPFTGHLLIAESSGHSRLLEVDPSGAVTWVFPTTSQPLARPLGAPDDAFYTPDGSSIVLNSESGQGAMVIARRNGTVLWQAGTYNVRGGGANHFNNPDDAVPAADGSVWMADIRNCRIVHLNGATGTITSALGGTGCRHNPPTQFAMPNGAFPTRDGSLVVTEIGGSWVTWINPDRTVRWTHHVPATYPSDGMAYPDGSVLLTDYSTLGQVIRIAADGTVLWRYAPRGTGQLDHPSIAIPLASNRV
ncbi:MAG: hypothetical protein M3R48_10215, partial [Candidatus Dormibacteraeota bacterium]|nr:hypothetical protein [Candidatus Dormibacteraeota bacterium]